MSSISQPVGNQPSLPLHRFSIDEYHRMIDAGILDENASVELLDGWIISRMSPHNPRHDCAIELVEDALRPLLPIGWRLRIQSAITTSDSEPEPDLVVVTGNARDRATRHPGPQEIALLIEVADSSLAFDRSEKSASYARAGISIYWIINLVNSQVEVYTEPSGPDSTPCYRQKHCYSVSEEVPILIEGQSVGQLPVRDLLP